MIDKKLMRAELSADESRKDKPYDDATGKPASAKGKITIGVGRNLTDRGLRDSEIDFMLDNDIAESEAELDKMAPWWRKMSDVRQRVLLNMHFNLGWTRLSAFSNTLAAMRDGNYNAAADGMLASLWAKQVGDRAVRLAKMMRAG